MAAIDKIYLNSFDTFTEFKNWCEAQPPIKDKYGKEDRISNYLYYHWYDPKYWKDNAEHPVMSTSYYIDAYIIRNCPIEEVQKELKLNYGSDYELIKEGELYASPSCDKYVRGRHFKIVKFPNLYKGHKCNYPIHVGKYTPSWSIEVKLPDYVEEKYMWWHSHLSPKKYSIGTWDFMSEHVISFNGWSSSCTYCKSIRALTRRITKWNLPIGTIVRVRGRYVNEEYEIIIKK